MAEALKHAVKVWIARPPGAQQPVKPGLEIVGVVLDGAQRAG